MFNEHANTTPAGATITTFPTHAEALTPSDATVYQLGLAVYVGGAGDVVVEPLHGGNTVTFAAAAGDLLPVTVRRVLATGTTATGLLGIY